MSYSTWGCRELDMTKQLSRMETHILGIIDKYADYLGNNGGQIAPCS